ncbi:uncharacterized protein LOC123203414 [Mangifera indica]|uniref:uncharacterized protein LOC123203414 n=1 Tax=Mangifera indica TaxID=29780 RepID=UPI001CF99CD4|nr:uncharacterized protein LOC123203414 [Mangifera indica]
MASNLVQLHVPMLTKDNYGKWCIQFKALFGSQDLWDIVSTGYMDPTLEEEEAYTPEQKNTLKDQRKKDKKALFFLYQGLDDNTFEKISKATTSKAIWDKLAIIHKGVERVKKNDEQLEDVRVIEKMLRSLTPSFKHVVTAIEESKNLEIMTIEELLGSFRVHELRIRKRVNNANCEQALELKMTSENNSGRWGRGRGSPAHRGCRHGRRRGNPIKTRNLQFGEGKSTLQCWNYK